MKRNLRPFDGIHPQLPESCFVDDTALIIGDAVLGEDCSVWPMAVIRRRRQFGAHRRAQQ